jgi:peptidyl-prolyl cis-trans isomerase B (cyclophilin B)
VQGNKIDTAQLNQTYLNQVKQNNPNFQYTPQQKEVYMRLGGTPFLDQNYTVFGEIISGLQVIDKIADVAKGVSDRPLKNVRMKMRLIN